MTASALAPAPALAHALAGLSGWQQARTPQHIACIDKAWQFADFEGAVWAFGRVAQLARAHDHHPDITVSHCHLRLRLWSHDAQGLTHKDVALAHAIDLALQAPQPNAAAGMAP